MFHLDFDALSASHVSTLKHPLVRAPNSIAVINSHELLVTNQHYFLASEYPLLCKAETYLAPPLGTVVHVRILANGSVDAQVVARLAYPNGIVLLNETTLAVSATNKAAVYLYTYEAATSDGSDDSADVSPTPPRLHPVLKYHSQIRVPFLPDTSMSRDGSLIIAGHPNLPILTKIRTLSPGV